MDNIKSLCATVRTNCILNGASSKAPEISTYMQQKSESTRTQKRYSVSAIDPENGSYSYMMWEFIYIILKYLQIFSFSGSLKQEWQISCECLPIYV